MSDMAIKLPAYLPAPMAFLRAMQENFITIWPDEVYARPVTHVRLGIRHLFTANTPDLVRHVLLDNAANYYKSRVARRLFRPALGDGLVTAEGATWKRHRQLMSPSFAQRRIAALVPAMVAETEACLQDWHAISGRRFDLTGALSKITLRIITRTMFGAESIAETTSISGDTAAYQRAARPSVLDFLGAPDWVPRPGMRRARMIGASLDRTIQAVIERRRRSPAKPEDLLSLLLEAVAANEASLREIRDEIATVFVAGHETTAAALAWTLLLLDRNPPATARLVDELDAVLGDRAPTAGDIELLTWTRQVIEESMRLFPPAHTITRLALGPDRLGEVDIPRGAVVVISPWLLHRNPELWPEPARFDPERFAPAAARARFSYIPFGAGPRICIGASLAMTEIIVVLATMLQRWRVSLPADHAVEPLALITLRPRHAVQATVAPRLAG